MKFTQVASLAAVAATGAQAQGVPAGSLVPATKAPSGYISTGNGKYQVTVVLPSDAPTVPAVQYCNTTGNALTFTLNNGILIDSTGKVGAIVKNRQFQFDGPPAQTGSIYTGGFSIAPNSSLAIGGTTRFWQCLSGGFNNLYDENIAAQCHEVRLNTLQCNAYNSGSSSVSAPALSQATDGQPQATGTASVVAQQTDGQPTAAQATVVSQISDGQVQAQSTIPSVPVVSQISDGQPQATAATNATITSAKPSQPIATGAAASVAGSGAIVGAVAIAAFFL